MAVELSDELQQARMRHLERISNSLFESQQDNIKIQAEQTKQLFQINQRLGALEQRVENLEKEVNRLNELVTLVLTDLAFIRDILLPGRKPASQSPQDAS